MSIYVSSEENAKHQMVRYFHFFSFHSINGTSVLQKVTTVADFSMQTLHLKLFGFAKYKVTLLKNSYIKFIGCVVSLLQHLTNKTSPG